MGISVFKTIRSPVAKVIYFTLALAFFIGFGILTSIQPKSSMPKIKYGDQDVYSDEFLLTFREFQGIEDMDETQLTRMAFDMLLARKSISTLMDDMGFHLTKDMITTIMMGSVGLQRHQDYINLIRTVGATKQSFENYVKDSYLFTKFQDMIVRIQTIGDFEEFQDIISWVSGTREAAFAEIKKTAFTIEILENEIKNYYLINQSDFKIPETRDLWIAKFPTPETASVFFNSITGRILEDFKEFDTLVKNIGGRATELRLGKDKATDVLAQLFSTELTEGTSVPPIQVGDEWWVIFVRKILKERIKTYEEATPEIKEILISRKLLTEVERFIEQNQKGVTSVADFERVFNPISEKITRERFPGYIGAYPVVGSVPELSRYVLSKSTNVIFPKAVQSDKKIYVIFLGEHFPSQEDAAKLLIFDTEKFIQDSVVFVLNRKKISPQSKEEAIKTLLGR